MPSREETDHRSDSPEWDRLQQNGVQLIESALTRWRAGSGNAFLEPLTRVTIVIWQDPSDSSLLTYTDIGI